MNEFEYMYGLKNILHQNLSRNYLFLLLNNTNTIEVYDQDFNVIFTIGIIFNETMPNNSIITLKRGRAPFDLVKVITRQMVNCF